MIEIRIHDIMYLLHYITQKIKINYKITEIPNIKLHEKRDSLLQYSGFTVFY